MKMISNPCKHSSNKPEIVSYEIELYCTPLMFTIKILLQIENFIQNYIVIVKGK